MISIGALKAIIEQLSSSVALNALGLEILRQSKPTFFVQSELLLSWNL